MKTVNLALMGFGNAARAFARILLEKEAMLAADYDACIRVTAIATGARWWTSAASTCRRPSGRSKKRAALPPVILPTGT